MILSIVTLIIIVIISYFIEARSQKLPAVVRTNKVVISTETSGTVKEYNVLLMQEVTTGDMILEMENPKLKARLETLKNEKQKYEELITSAKSGDHLNMELFELDEDILKNGNDLQNTQLEKDNISNKLAVYSEKYKNAVLQYDASRELFSKGIINSAEFEDMTNDFLNISNKYNELRSDSLRMEKELETIQSMIDILKAQKSMLSSNVSLIASKHLIDRDEINSKIHDLEQDIANLKIYAPAKGTVTDIYYKPGEKIKSGDVVAEIATIQDIWIIAYGNSFSRRSISPGQKVKVYCGNGKKIFGRVVSVSPIMEKVKALSSSFETVNTYSKIEVHFDDDEAAWKNVTPGERLMVRIYFKN